MYRRHPHSELTLSMMSIDVMHTQGVKDEVSCRCGVA